MRTLAMITEIRRSFWLTVFSYSTTRTHPPLDGPWPPCRRSHPAGVTRRPNQSATVHAAFALASGTRPSELRSFVAAGAFTSATARQLADHPERWPCRWASERRSPFVLPSYGASGSCLDKRASAMPIVCPPARWRFVSIYCQLRSEKRLRTTGNLGKDADVCRTTELSGKDARCLQSSRGKFFGEEPQMS